MASWTTPVLHSTGDDLAVGDWNGIANNETFLYQKPYGLYYNSISTSCANGTDTQVTLGGTSAAGYGFSVSSNNVIVPLTGLYSVMYSIQMNVDATTTLGNAFLVFVTQSLTPISQSFWSPTQVVNFPGAAGSCMTTAAAGTPFGLYVGNVSGEALPTQPIPYVTYLHMAYLGSQ